MNHIFRTLFLNKDIYKFQLEQIPIPNGNQLPVIALVNQILAAQKADSTADTSALEQQIDRLVYELYGLTNAEVKLIDPEAIVSGADDDLFKA